MEISHYSGLRPSPSVAAVNEKFLSRFGGSKLLGAAKFLILLNMLNIYFDILVSFLTSKFRWRFFYKFSVSRYRYISDLQAVSFLNRAVLTYNEKNITSMGDKCTLCGNRDFSARLLSF